MDFTELYRRHADGIYRLAWRLLRDPEAASDATQEAFTRALGSWDRFRGEAQPRTWLYRIAYNVCLTRLSGVRPPQLDDKSDERPDPARTRPEAEAEREEACRLVRGALGGLAEEDRRVLCLLMDPDLAYGELAGILGCSVEAARMRASRARRRLRDVLEPLMEEET